MINRLGFNNHGLAPYLLNLSQHDKNLGIVGANIGRNKTSIDAVADYVTGLNAVYPVADYITVNISSPNTQGLRALQEKSALENLLGVLSENRNSAAVNHKVRVPLLLKIAPDLDASEMEDIADVVLAKGIDGVIVSNTTITRPDTLASGYAKETGGLSGAPLFAFSTAQLKRFYQISGGKIPLVGVGGVSTAQDAYAKIRAGASLVQLYTALVYQGFGVVDEIRRGLAECLLRDGFNTIQQAVGVDA